MRVLFLHHSGVPGGAEKSILELALALRARGVEPCFVLPSSGYLPKELTAVGVPVHQADLPKLKRTLNPLKLASYLSARSRLSGVVREIVAADKIDLLHFNSLSAAVLFGEGVADGPPSIMHLRDSIVPKPVFSAFAAGMTAYVAISEYMEEVLTRYLKVPDHKVFSITNGLVLPQPATEDEKAKARKKLGIAPDTVVFLSVGAFVPWKNQTSLLDAFKILRKHHHGTKLIVCGSDITGEAGEHAKKITASCKALEPDCEAAGQVKDMTRWFQAADIFVHPAIGEPFGRVVAEAQAAGLPAVVYRSGALPQIVSDGETGLVVNLHAKSFAEAMGRLATDSALRAAMGASGAQRARELFDIERCASGMQELYQRTITGDLPAPPPQPAPTQRELRDRRRMKAAGKEPTT